MDHPQRPRILSLFSGIGGLDCGVKLAVPGARVIAHIERERFACEVLATRMEEGSLDPAPIWSDVFTFDCEPWRGEVDLITAGWPCPPVSVAGKRKAQDDERWLWPEVVRIIREVQPRWFFGENVRGLLSAGDGSAFADVLWDLADLGMSVEWCTLRASDVGAPHKRERVFILASNMANRRGAGQQGEPLGADTPGREEPTGSSGRELADGDRRGLRGLRGNGLLAGEREARRDDVDGCGGEEAGVADTGDGLIQEPGRGPEGRAGAGSAGEVGRVADGERQGLEGRSGSKARQRNQRATTERVREDMADAESDGSAEHADGIGQPEEGREDSLAGGEELGDAADDHGRCGECGECGEKAGAREDGLGRRGSTSAGPDVPHPERSELREQSRGSGGESRPGAEEPGAGRAGWGPPRMADADGGDGGELPRADQRAIPEQDGGVDGGTLPGLFPPGPGERERWAELLERWPWLAPALPAEGKQDVPDTTSRPARSTGGGEAPRGTAEGDEAKPGVCGLAHEFPSGIHMRLRCSCSRTDMLRAFGNSVVGACAGLAFSMLAERAGFEVNDDGEVTL